MSAGLRSSCSPEDSLLPRLLPLVEATCVSWFVALNFRGSHSHLCSYHRIVF